MNVYDVIRRPLITEKGHGKREAERTLCFEVHPDANKIEIKQAVETVFQGESRRRADEQLCRQAAPPGTFHRLRFRLEKSLCASAGRAKTP